MKHIHPSRVVMLATVASVLAAAADARMAAALALHQTVIAEQVLPPPTEAPAADVASVMRSLSSRAGIVFVGQVERIQPNGGVVDIVFTVQQRVAGELGATYTLREWSGRWSGGQQHFTVGERAMVFLYPPNAAGISSPVDGMAGVVPLIPMGEDAEPLLDVRFLATRVERPVGAPIADSDFGAIALGDALAIVGGSDQGPLPQPVKRPLPPGLRPHPVKPWSDVGGEVDQSNLEPVLQLSIGADVEH
jgi:hypothetical protein